MALNDKLDATKDKVSGKVKETTGKVTGDEKLEAKGYKVHSLFNISEVASKFCCDCRIV